MKRRVLKKLARRSDRSVRITMKRHAGFHALATVIALTKELFDAMKREAVEAHFAHFATPLACADTSKREGHNG